MRKPLEQVVQWTADQEEQAAQALAACAKRLEEAKSRLETLARFRAEYASQLNQAPTNAGRLSELHAFLCQLNQAIAQQEETLERLRQEYAALQLAWRQAHCRHRGIEKVQANRLRRKQLALERKLQRELDDRAARLWIDKTRR